jgi:alpha-1,3-rhamnosyl/mannosyltransferase
LERAAPGWRFTVYLNRQAASWPLPGSEAFERVVCPVDGHSRAARYFFEQVRLPSVLREGRVSLVHSLGYVSPLRTVCPRVVTVHDLHYRHYGTSVMRRRTLEFFVRRSIRGAHAVVVDSAFIGRELSAAFGTAIRRLTVIPAAAGARPETDAAWRARARASLHLPERYFVAFGSVAPNKNIPRLLEAFAHARQSDRLPHELVIVGHLPSELAATTAPGVRHTGYLPAVTADAVLEGAEALLFPSYYEGFGLPVLEAMQAGVPVVASDRASLPEVGGDAALYFNALDVAMMAQRIVEVAQDDHLRARLRERGWRRAAEFSWSRAAESLVSLYQEVLQAGARES